MSLAQSQQSPPKARYTVDEYLRSEYDAEEKHEYRDGEIVSMAGGSAEHSLVASNVGREVGNGLKGGPCRAYNSDLRVRVQGTPLYTYPDVTVICGPTEYDPNDPTRQTVTNPRLIVEVLSPSTEAYDRGEKFDRYSRADTLQEYVLVSQLAPRVQTFQRRKDGSWLFRHYSGLEAVARLESIGVELPLAEVFAGVVFPPANDEISEKREV